MNLKWINNNTKLTLQSVLEVILVKNEILSPSVALRTK